MKGHLILVIYFGAGEATVDADLIGNTLSGTFTFGKEKGTLLLERVGAFRRVGENTSLTPQQWRTDLDYLSTELAKRHPSPYRFCSKSKWTAVVSRLRRRVGRMTPPRIYFDFDRIANLVGDAHTYVQFPQDRGNMPIDIKKFGTDYRVVAATRRYRGLLGLRVVGVGSAPIALAKRRLDPITPAGETQWLRDDRELGFLTTGITLCGARISDSSERVEYRFVTENGVPTALTVDAVGDSDREPWLDLSAHPPLYRQNRGKGFWFQLLPDSRTLYCCFRSYESLDAGAKAMLEFAKTNKPLKIVIDLRENGGGDFYQGLNDLVKPIAATEWNRRGGLFVLIGPSTFSAAMSNAAQFRNLTHARLVGQPIGERPNSYQEVQSFTLPNCGWTVHYSTKYYEFAPRGTKEIRPDKLIQPTWSEYRSGRDPVLEWVERQSP